MLDLAPDFAAMQIQRICSSRSNTAMRVTLSCALGSFVISLAIGIWTLCVAHPAEDALILFKYVDNAAAGNGIVFYAGGPRAEGATDFLWFAMLVGLRWVGCDVAVAAALLNAIGAAIASWLFTDAVRDTIGQRASTIVLAVLALGTTISGGALPGYLGFSSMLYSAFVLLLFVKTLTALGGRGAGGIPFIGLVVGLMRPDGVILGCLFTVVGWRAACRNGDGGRFRRNMLLAALCGALYYAWRTSYFGLPLPLSLYLKAAGKGVVGWERALSSPSVLLPSLPPTLDWFWQPLGPWLFASICVGLFVVAGRKSASLGLHVALCFVPLLVFLLAMSFARQTQNTLFRFQAPAQLALQYSVVVAAACAAQRMRSALGEFIVCALATCSVVPTFVDGVRMIERIWHTHVYLDTFGVELGKRLTPDRRIALTEAGHIGFWIQAQVEDITGLNTPRYARRQATIGDIDEFDPDIVMCYVGLLGLVKYFHQDSGQVVVVPRALLAEALANTFPAASQLFRPRFPGQ